MNYHMIRTDDMLNGDGLRVIIFLSGCRHHCKGCHNPETWDINSGKHFDEAALNNILKELNKDYISGITISGGEPLLDENAKDVLNLICTVKQTYPNKTIWLYTGYTYENIMNFKNSKSITNSTKNDNEIIKEMVMNKCDVVCDGKFIQSLADVNCPWVGSTNQRVINIKETIKKGEIVLWKE